MLKVVAVILARLSSTRLPGKVLMPLNGKNTIARLSDICSRSKFIQKVVLATSKEPSDKKLEDYGKSIGLDVYRGNLTDVLGRFTAAAAHSNADIIVYIGGDCPLLDIELIDNGISLLMSEKYDFVTNYEPPTYPNGHDLNIITSQALDKVNKAAQLPFERTNIFSFISFNKKLFDVKNVAHQKNFSSYQLALDDEDDFNVLNRICKFLDHAEIYNYEIDYLVEVSKSTPEFFDLLQLANKNRIAGNALLSSGKIVNELLGDVADYISNIECANRNIFDVKSDIKYASDLLEFIKSNVD